MQTNIRKKQSAHRMQKINAISLPTGDWYAPYPELKLSGQWLRQLGFDPGKKVLITSTQKELVISLI